MSDIPAGETLQSLMAPLADELDATPQPDNEPSSETVARINNAARIAEITEET